MFLKNLLAQCGDWIKIAPQYVVPKLALSAAMHRLAQCEYPWVKNPFIKIFSKLYQVNLGEAVREHVHDYRHFNDFFTRTLRPGVRTWVEDPKAIGSPVDGFVSEFGVIRQGSLIQAKQKNYALTRLLGGNEGHAALFQQGQYATLYLSPRDYHRVHMPMAGRLTACSYIPGDLFAVNFSSSRRIQDLFCRNERLVCLFDTAAGPMAVILVGAFLVGGMGTGWLGQITPPHGKKSSQSLLPSIPLELARGQELGWFNMGSTVIALFAPGRTGFSRTLVKGNPIKLGQLIAHRQ